MGGCLRAVGVTKRYGATVALDGVDVEFCRGLNVVVGPNGSGKSTLLRILVGLTRPSAGRVESLGLDPWRERARLYERLAFAFESTRLPWWLTGLEVLRLYSSSRGVPLARLVEEAEGLGLGGALGRSVRGYSMGMRKKLLLSMALAGEWEALLLDEPYTLLDADSRAILDGRVERAARESTVVVASHVFTPALESADRMIVLVNGRVVAREGRGALARVYRCPRSGVDLHSLLGEARSLHVEGESVIVEYGSPREPPSPGCRPVLRPPSTWTGQAAH